MNNDSDSFIKIFYICIVVAIAAFILNLIVGCQSVFAEEVSYITPNTTTTTSNNNKCDSLVYLQEKERVYWYMRNNKGRLPEDAFIILKDNGFTEEMIAKAKDQVIKLYNSKAGE